jgi:hypothetical protein
MPNRAKQVPFAGIPPEHPILDQLTDSNAVKDVVGNHGWLLFAFAVSGLQSSLNGENMYGQTK